MENLSKNKKTVLMFAVFSILFLLSRIPRISSDEINPDGVNWHYRMQQFVVGLKTGQLEKIYQHYHPGVTFMWIAGIPVEIYKQITNINNYDMYNFQIFHLVAKLSVVLVQLLLSLLAICLLSRLVGRKKAFLIAVLFSFEPFFLGNSRLFHMDVLLALFTLDALLITFIALKNKNLKSAVFSGVFLTFSFLTKSIGIGALVFVLFYTIFTAIKEKNGWYVKKFIPVLLISFIISLFLVFPAMFKGPVYYLSEIFKESERIGIRNGHGQIIFGEYTREAGFSFYPLVLLMKISPLTLAGVLIFLIFVGISLVQKKIKIEKILNNPLFFCAVFYLGYFFVMSFPSKKIDRYMIPVYPFLAWVSVEGFMQIIKKSAKNTIPFTAVLLVSLAVFIVYPDIKLFPYYFTYTSPLFGSPEQANKIIAQKPFGIGIFDLKNALVSRYGSKAKLGFIDIKPIEAIYPNSQVFDIRDYGPGSYDYIVLGINEDLTDRVKNDGRYIFEKDFSLNINGLEYWRVYAKKIK